LQQSAIGLPNFHDMASVREVNRSDVELVLSAPLFGLRSESNYGSKGGVAVNPSQSTSRRRICEVAEATAA
jgi:hypothetical protein